VFDINVSLTSCKGKGKVHPRTGHEGPEGEQVYSSTLSSTSPLNELGGQGQDSAALPPGKKGYPLNRRLDVGPRDGLDGCGKSRPHRDSIPVPCSSERVAIPTELNFILIHIL
jgi:hypothetical protein